MAKTKIIKPGTVVYDVDMDEYVVFKADSVDHKGKAYVFNPRCAGTYLTTVRPLNRKERGES
jgi:hypothetical protein